MSAHAVPAPWRALYVALNGDCDGGRVPDGEPGIRDVDATCDAFQPAGAPNTYARGVANGCETDGHYLCVECVEIDIRTLRRRRDLCEDCGAKIERRRGPWGDEDACSADCGVRS